MVLDERAGVLPITESDSETNVRISNVVWSSVSSPVVIWASSEVKNDSEDDESNNCEDLNGAAM